MTTYTRDQQAVEAFQWLGDIRWPDDQGPGDEAYAQLAPVMHGRGFNLGPGGTLMVRDEYNTARFVPLNGWVTRSATDRISVFTDADFRAQHTPVEG